MKQAIELLERVIAKDPAYALAYAALSEAYSILDDFGGLPPEAAYPKAIAAARRALELDPYLAEAHAVLGHILLHQRRWDDCKRELRRAIELNPSLAAARHWYSNALAWTGDIEAGLREAREAYELDPSSSSMALTVGSRLYELRRPEEAIAIVRNAAEANPRSIGPPYILAWIYSSQNRHDEALAAARKLLTLTSDRYSKVVLAYVHARAGRSSEARRLLSELEASVPATGEPHPTDMAELYVALGETEKALSVLEHGLRQRPGILVGFELSPDMDALRNEPRFRRIVDAVRSGIPPDSSR
jgi:tetratricopeptide (TPR) repeat protein